MSCQVEARASTCVVLSVACSILSSIWSRGGIQLMASAPSTMPVKPSASASATDQLIPLYQVFIFFLLMSISLVLSLCVTLRAHRSLLSVGGKNRISEHANANGARCAGAAAGPPIRAGEIIFAVLLLASLRRCAGSRFARPLPLSVVVGGKKRQNIRKEGGANPASPRSAAFIELGR